MRPYAIMYPKHKMLQMCQETNYLTYRPLGRLIGSLYIYLWSLRLPFGIFGLCLARKGCPRVAPGSPRGFLKEPKGVPSEPKGSPGVDFRLHLAPFGLPLGPAAALGCSGSYSQVCSNLDLQFRANGSHLRCLRIKNGLAEFIRGDPRRSPYEHEVRLGPQLATPLRSRRGPG